MLFGLGLQQRKGETNKFKQLKKNIINHKINHKCCESHFDTKLLFKNAISYHSISRDFRAKEHYVALDISIMKLIVAHTEQVHHRHNGRSNSSDGHRIALYPKINSTARAFI